MPSLDFEAEKIVFRDFYDANRQLLEDAKDSFLTLLNALLVHVGTIAISKIEGRVKDRNECIRKFQRKYQKGLEQSGTDYDIRSHISDLIGVRIVCLYEDEISAIRDALADQFEILDVTDKISNIESTEGLFGYKGLHLDVVLNDHRKPLAEYRAYAEFPFEIQVRTIIQDSWSVLDHKIKYKKSIPNHLRRRINTLAALFELADHEFKAIRLQTEEEIRKAASEPEVIDEPISGSEDTAQLVPVDDAPSSGPGRRGSPPLDAFGFLRIAQHFFPHFSFEPHKVDGFTQEIVRLQPEITRRNFNYYVKSTIGTIKRYQDAFEAVSSDSGRGSRMNPYTIIRHCLYLADGSAFEALLTDNVKHSFNSWRGIDEAASAMAIGHPAV